MGHPATNQRPWVKTCVQREACWVYIDENHGANSVDRNLTSTNFCWSDINALDPAVSQNLTINALRLVSAPEFPHLGPNWLSGILSYFLCESNKSIRLSPDPASSAADGS